MATVTARRWSVNAEVARELTDLADKRFTGCLEVVERDHRARGRCYLYDGGLYAADLDGYAPPIAARLDAAGAFDALSDADRDMLAALSDPDGVVGLIAVERGWLSADGLARVHQEYVLACLGAMLAVPRAKTRTHRGAVTSHGCTLPVDVASLVSNVERRAERLDGSWRMVGSGRAPGAAVLRRTEVAFDGRGAEVEAMAAQVDGMRSVDELAGVLGLTRAEAVHVALILVEAGLAQVDDDAPPADVVGVFLVPEQFGSWPVPATGPEPAVPTGRRAPEPAADPEPVGPPTAASPTAASPTAAPAVAGEPVRVSPPSAAASALATPTEPIAPSVPSENPGDSLGHWRGVVDGLHDELMECVRVEHAAIARTMDVTTRLADARARLAALQAEAGA